MERCHLSNIPFSLVLTRVLLSRIIQTKKKDVEVTPSRGWSAISRNNSSSTINGEVSEISLDDHSQPSLLGLSLRLCNPDGALEKVRPLS